MFCLKNEDYYLIHFTSFKTAYKEDLNRDETGFNNLLGIIKNGFRFNKGATYTPRYSNGSSGIELHVGMICFTEVQKKTININNDKFGKFGICMKREWVEKYSGQPVLYTLNGSINNSLLLKLDDLIFKTNQIYQETNDKRIEEVSSSLANISIHFQAFTEVRKYKDENEWRIIDDPQNTVLENALKPLQNVKNEGQFDIIYSELFLPINNGDDGEFFIIPKEYKDLFCEKVINSKHNIQKILFFEDL